MSEVLTPASDPHNIVRDISPYERAITEGDTSYVVWRNGPRAGEVYDAVRQPDDAAALNNLLTMDEVERRLLEEMQSETGASGALRYVYEMYYGDENRPGLQIARLFDLDGEGRKYHEFITAFERQDRWRYLESLAQANGIEGVEFVHPNSTVLKSSAAAASGKLTSLFYARVPDPDEPRMGLMHHTLGCSFPAAVEMGALLSCNELEKNGLAKTSGENKWGKGAGPEYVYFWPNSQYNYNFAPFSAHHGLDYPIVWGIDQERLAQLEETGDLTHVPGSWQRERRVFGRVVLQAFTNLWVPPFAVEQHSRILSRHGYDDITVAAMQLGSRFAHR